MKRKIKLGEAVPKEWFNSKEAKEINKKIMESTKKLSDAMRSSLVVPEPLLKSKVTI